MIKVAMNIGSSAGAYNSIPMFWEMKNARDFTDMIREDIFTILLWSHDNYGQSGNLWLGVHIHEDIDDENFFEWNFTILCKNIRDFKPYMKMSRDEIDALRISKEREEKLKDILDESETNL